MNNKYLKKANTVIELTSLMDVIFILLAVVMCRQQLDMTEKQKNAEVTVIEAQEAVKEAGEMMDAAEAALSENAMLKEQLELCSDVFSQVTFVTVKLTYEPNHPETRRIRTILNDDEPKVLATLTRGDAKKGFDELSEYLASVAETAGDSPVILKVDRSQILYRDDKELTMLIRRLDDTYDNLFVKEGTNE